MQRICLMLALLAGLGALALAAACGDKGGGGVAALGGSPSPSASSPSASPSPTLSPSPTPTVTSTPTITGSPTDDPFGDDGEMSAEELDAYLGEVRPIYKELMRIERISGGMLVEVPTVAGPSWDVAARRTEGYADEIGVQLRLFREIVFPADLQKAHDAMAESLQKEVEMLDLLATQLRDRTWDPVKGTKDVNRLSREFIQLRDQYRAELEAASADLGVPIPWKWQ